MLVEMIGEEVESRNYSKEIFKHYFTTDQLQNGCVWIDEGFGTKRAVRILGQICRHKGKNCIFASFIS